MGGCKTSLYNQLPIIMRQLLKSNTEQRIQKGSEWLQYRPKPSLLHHFDFVTNRNKLTDFQSTEASVEEDHGTSVHVKSASTG